jgi:dipeptidyl aminopeptidase/acylaminoacyl peptidase
VELVEPTWTPSGDAVAFSRVRFDYPQRRAEIRFHSSIREVGLDGGGSSVLLRNASSPAFSPDGTRLAFARQERRECGEGVCPRPSIYVAPTDGGEATRITSDRGHAYEPVWSADGRTIAFVSDRNAPVFPTGLEIYSVRPDGSCMTWLTNGSPASYEPAWSPDLASSDAEACGATSRRPVVEVNPTRADNHTPLVGLYLGKVFHGLLLTSAYHYNGEGRLSYVDCGRYRRADCPPGATLEEETVCSRDAKG